MAAGIQTGIAQTLFASSVTAWNNIALASDIAQGDLLVCHVMADGPAYSSNTGGYGVIGNAADTSGARSLVLAKIAGASEATFNITMASGARGIVRHMRIKGHAPSSTWGTPTTNASTGTNINSIVVPAYTRDTNDELVLLFGAAQDNGGSDIPSGFAEVYDVALSSPARTSSLYSREYTSPGSTGTVTYKLTGSANAKLAAVLIGVRAAPGDLVGAVGF